MFTGTPSTPILVESRTTSDESKNPMLKYRVESFAPIEEYELLYKEQDKADKVSIICYRIELFYVYTKQYCKTRNQNEHVC